jgi:hypothetical protein
MVFTSTVHQQPPLRHTPTQTGQETEMIVALRVDIVFSLEKILFHGAVESNTLLHAPALRHNTNP